MSFEELKRRIGAGNDSESFEEWDDFIIWESCESARRYWIDAEIRLKGQDPPRGATIFHRPNV